MGLLNLFSRSGAAVQRLPSGSLTIDRHGRIVATTVSSAYPEELLQAIADAVIGLFRKARTAQMPLTELTIHFASLQISAREMRGGAIVYLSPKSASFTAPSST
jgi:hypothetical protein